LVRVTVPIEGRSYEAAVGAGILAETGSLLPPLPKAERAFVVADRAVVDRGFGTLAGGLKDAGLDPVLLPVPSGEEAKTLPVFGALLHQLATQEAHRADPIVAFGGGSTGDLAGFVASTYMRGLPLIQVPTTLTGQVDSAIGGKTAVNLPEGKNLVGTFFQPRAVIADVDLLASLSDRDFSSGLAEVAKYGLAFDPALLTQLETDPGPVLARESEIMVKLVARCIELKAAAVVEDERDTGARLTLNYGHTLGHALERLEAFTGRSHGEAVAIGMVFAARLAEALGTAAPGLATRTIRVLTSLGLETDGPLPPVDDVLAAFRLDKKFHGGVRLVLLEDVGRPVVVDDVPLGRVAEILGEMGASR
jgi:3-dehydroquinate synthase